MCVTIQAHKLSSKRVEKDNTGFLHGLANF